MKVWISVTLLAACALSAYADDVKNKTELNVFGGGAHIEDLGNKGIFGVSAGYGVAPIAQVFGEYSYVHIGENVSARGNLFTGGVKINLMRNSDKVEPYGLVAGGGVRSSCDGCDSETDGTFHLGGGVRILAPSKKWGVTPEVRWIRVFSNGSDSNVVSYTGGVFFRW